MCTITKNEKFNSFELTFDGKPSEQIRDILKANGYRWNGKRGIWYGYKDISALLNGEQNITVTPTTTAADNTAAEQTEDKRTQAALLEEYLKILAIETWTNNPKMIDYERKTIARIYQTEQGYLIAINKPKIETNFCFGYGQNGVSSGEDYKEAEKVRSHAAADTNYFLSENTKELRGIIEQIQKYELRTRTHYIGAPEHSRVKSLETIDGYFTRLETADRNGWEVISEKDRAGLVDAYKKVLADFEKRLQTYLKRYGLTKLNTWTYLSD